MPAVAGGRLSKLLDRGLGVAERQPEERAWLSKLAAKQPYRHPLRAAGDLTERAIGRRAAPQERRQSHQPFVADRRRLDDRAVVEDGDKRHDAALDEVDVIDFRILLVQY